MQYIIRTCLFLVFFSIGGASLSVSVLSDDLIEYYQNKSLIKAAQERLKKLESLNAEYDALLNKLEKDPNLVKRIAPAAIGVEPQDSDTIYPKARAEELAAARKALLAQSNRQPQQQAVPSWLLRCSGPRRRMILFIAGAVLVLTSFACFRPRPQDSQ